MQHPAVVEDDQVALLPVVRVHVAGRDAGPLQAVHDLADLGQVVDDGAVGEVQPADGRGVDLEGELARDWVLPAEGEDLDGGGVDGGEVAGEELFGLGDDAEAGGPGFGRGHPDVRVGGVFDLCGAGEVLVFIGEDVVHGLAVDKGRRTERHGHLIVRAIIIPQNLGTARRHLDSQQCSRNRRRQPIQRSVNMPPVEPGVVQVILIRDGGLMKGPVVRVAEPDVLETLVLGHEAVADDLNLRLVGDRLEVRVQDGALGIEGLAVAVGALGGRVEALGELVLGLGGGVGLVLDD